MTRQVLGQGNRTPARYLLDEELHLVYGPDRERYHVAVRGNRGVNLQSRRTRQLCRATDCDLSGPTPREEQTHGHADEDNHSGHR